MKGAYSFIKELWKRPKENLKNIYKERLIEWRGQGSVVRIDKPTRLDRARALGYKAKPGVVLVRSRVRKGVTKRRKIKKGRRPKRYGYFIAGKKSKQRIAEQRASKKFPNLEVLNSYWVGDDSKRKWYEIIMLNPSSPSIKSDKDLKWICSSSHRKRVQRGKTSSSKRSRKANN